jgi:hypothetical protein
MKSFASLLFSFVVAAAAVTSERAFAEPYLFEVLANQTYLKSWNVLFAGEKDVDLWLVRYAKTKNGPAAPGTMVQIGSTEYQINSVCKPHDCENNQFVVLFSPKGAEAWGLLLKDKKTERFFGRPSEEKKQALRAAVSQ